MLSELINAPGTIQLCLDGMLETLNWQFALTHLHDIIMFSKLLLEHVEHVSQELQLLSDGRVTLKLKERPYFTDNIDYLRT